MKGGGAYITFLLLPSHFGIIQEKMKWLELKKISNKTSSYLNYCLLHGPHQYN